MDIGKFDEPRKPNRKCPYGFTCKNHPWGNHKITKDCKYFDQCKKIVREIAKASINLNTYEKYIDEIAKESKEYGVLALEDNRAKCYSGTYQQTSLFLKAIEQHERVVIFLRERGNHQSPDSLGVDEQISLVKKSLKQLESQLKMFERGYIAPEEVKMKTCNPKRDSANKEQKSETYNCYKLQSTKAEFKTLEGKANPKCKSIYLGKVDNEKYIQGKLGIERRKRLLKIRTKLTQAVKAIEEAAELADAEFDIDLYTASNEDGN